MSVTASAAPAVVGSPAPAVEPSPSSEAALRVMADLPDINDFSEDQLRALSGCVLHALCDAYGAPSSCTQESTTKEICVTYLRKNVMGRNIPWMPLLAAFKKKQRDSFQDFFDRQNEVHRHLKTEQQSIRDASDFLATIASGPDATGSLQFPATERKLTPQMEFLAEAFVCDMENLEDLADVLPKSAQEILEDFLKGFADRQSAPNAALQEDAEHTGYAFIVFFCLCVLY